MRVRIIGYLITAVLAGTVPHAIVAQPASPFGKRDTALPPSTDAADTAQITPTTDDVARLRVDVSIGGTPLHFLVDTASTRSVIAAEVASRLDLPRGPTVTVHNIGGSDRVPSVIIPQLQFANLSIRNVTAPALLQKNLGGEGFIGLDIMHGQRLTITFRPTSILTISPSARHPHADDPQPNPGTIVVIAKLRHGELILTNAEIEGETVSVVIDTGSEDSVGNEPLRQLVNRQIEHTEMRSIGLVGVTGRILPADFTQIEHVKIGGAEIRNLPIAFADVVSFRQFGLSRRPAILLGMSAIRLFDSVTLDFARRQVWFLLRPAAVP